MTSADESSPPSGVTPSRASDVPSDSTTRFSNRVDDYIKHRPGYPPALLSCLTREFGLLPTHVIGDIGSGTGISSEIFLRNGNIVYGVEPNAEMRHAGERLLAGFPSFRTIAASAEATTLPPSSMDWIMAGQAFHWFDVPRTRGEFRRILRRAGRVALFWNNRREDTPFLRAYEDLVRHFATDYAQVKHQNAEQDGRIAELFGSCGFVERNFDNRQIFDFPGLQGRVLSSSYMPAADHPRHAPMLQALRALFDSQAQTGKVEFEYETRLYIGSLQ